MKRKLRIYAAGPLFNDGELWTNIRNVKKLREQGYLVMLPQEHGLVASPHFNMKDGETEDEIRSVGNGNIDFATKEFREQIGEDDMVAIKEADVIVGNADGPEPDSGTMAELGIGKALGMPVYAIRSDRRTYCDPVMKLNNFVLFCVTYHRSYETVEDILPFLKELQDKVEEEEGTKTYKVPAYNLKDTWKNGIQPTKELEELTTSSKVGDVKKI